MNIIKIEVKSENRQYLIKITDNGVGVCKDDLPKIFDPFYTKKIKSKGLGLTLVKNILIAHQGNIEITAKPSKGTVVKMMIPMGI